MMLTEWLKWVSKKRFYRLISYYSKELIRTQMAISKKNRTGKVSLQHEHQLKETQKVTGDLMKGVPAMWEHAFSMLDNEADNKAQIWMGFEWENSDDRNKTQNLIRNLHTKEISKYLNWSPDGQLELISIPATLEFHKWYLSEHFFKERLDGTLKEPHDRAGFHVHIDHKSLNPRTLIRMMAFMHLKDNEKFCTEICQRPMDIYSTRNTVIFKHMKYGKQKRISGCNLKFDENFKRLDMPDQGRCIFNCFSHHGTLEMRMFRSSIRMDEVFMKLEFVHALVTYCRKACFNKLYVEEFIEFIYDNMNTYPYLFNSKPVQSRISLTSKKDLLVNSN